MRGHSSIGPLRMALRQARTSGLELMLSQHVQQHVVEMS